MNPGMLGSSLLGQLEYVPYYEYSVINASYQSAVIEEILWGGTYFTGLTVLNI